MTENLIRKRIHLKHAKIIEIVRKQTYENLKQKKSK